MQPASQNGRTQHLEIGKPSQQDALIGGMNSTRRPGKIWVAILAGLVAMLISRTADAQTWNIVGGGD